MVAPPALSAMSAEAGAISPGSALAGVVVVVAAATAAAGAHPLPAVAGGVWGFLPLWFWCQQFIYGVLLLGVWVGRRCGLVGIQLICDGLLVGV